MPEEMHNCHDCGAKPGEVHHDQCDVQRCSVCGGQRLMCLMSTGGCKGHDKKFARWSGFWPGSLEAAAMGIDLNELSERELHKILFVKPKGK